jgi:acyl carrier protein
MDEEKTIKKVISETLGVSIKDLHGDSDLREDLNAQDLEIVDLLMKLEKLFKVNITPEETKKTNTVDDIIELFVPH